MFILTKKYQRVKQFIILLYHGNTKCQHIINFTLLLELKTIIQYPMVLMVFF